MDRNAEHEIRVALIGFGLGGASFHAPLIAATPGMMLATIVTSNEERATQARRTYPNARIIASTKSLWADAGAHDLAVITTPNRYHATLALEALAVGLPVVLDKPFARTAAEALRVIHFAHEKRLPIIPYHNRRWDGEYLTLRRLIDAGRLGRIFRFESRFERWRPQLKGGWRERGDTDEAGGLLYDLGTHLIDQALALFGPVQQVYAELDRRRTGAQTDDDAFVALTHANGVRSHLWTSAVAAHFGPRMRVLGERGAFVKQDADPQEAALRGGKIPVGPEWGVELPDAWGFVTDGVGKHPVQSEPGAYQKFYSGVCAMLRGVAPPPVLPEDAVAGLQIIEAAQRSAADHRVIELNTQPRR
ncbi:MAG: Gfo/Idh/MocA family protein [Steroidobacteraceae bacterium]